MHVQKTIKAKIFALTKTKELLLSREYNNWQALIKSLCTNNPNCIDTYSEIELYSATKQQALRYCRKLKPKPNQPMIIRRDTINIQKRNTKLSKYWAKIPIYKHSIKVAIQFPYNQEKLLKESIRQAKLIKKKKGWFLYITIKKEIKIKQSYSSILAIDLGEKVIATAVLSVNQKPIFYGKEIRGIRRHYAWLRKRLGNRKLLKVIKRIGHKEKRIVDDLLHKISHRLVEIAHQHNAVIVLGDLKGIRSSAKGKGKRFNRIISNMPYYKLTQYIEYKANWLGIKVIKIPEKYTSITCSRCGSKGTRPHQGLFRCPSCGYQANADFNGAKNILKRSWEYISQDGVAIDTTLN